MTPNLSHNLNSIKRASQSNKKKTPSQILKAKEYQSQRRLNMDEELAEIEKQRLANLNRNRVNKKTEKEAMHERKIKYLKEFNSSANGPLNEQDWVGPEMDLFHEKMSKLEMFYCENCSELWPSMTKECSTCKKHKNLYHSENKMRPSHSDLPIKIKKLFEELTMVIILIKTEEKNNKKLIFSKLKVEEMLISPVLTVMSVYRLKGGQLLSRGYVANFTQDILQTCLELPRLTSQIPLLTVKKTGQDNNVKELIVNRERVTTLVKFLCDNNQDWKSLGITYKENNANNLPENVVPNDLNQIEKSESAPDTLDNIIIETGPNIQDDTEESNDKLIQTIVESDLEIPFQVDRISDFIKINWPTVDPTPINEFKTDGLASLAFPSLFPLGLGDPTKKGRIQEVSETDGFKHLLKFATKHTKTNEYYYPFVTHTRFKFWAYDRIRRHRALDQAKIYLRDNLGY